MTAPAIKRRSNVVAGAADNLRAKLAAKTGFDSNPFKGVEWSPAYVAFSAYIFAIITYRFPIGTASMSVAVLALPLEKRALRFPAVAALSFAFIGWALIGMVSTSYPAVVSSAVSDFAKVCAVVFVAVNVIVTRGRFRAFVVGSIILFLLFPVRGTMISFFIMHGDVGGRAAWNYIYSNPNDLAALCLLQLSVAIGIVAVERRKWVLLGTKVTIGLLVLIVVLTQSRGGMIALGVFAVIGGKKYFRNPTGIISVLAVVILVYLVAPDSVWRRFSTLKTAGSTEVLDPELMDLATRQDQGSSQQRLAIWAIARTIISENPVAGVGLGAYPEEHYVVALRPTFTFISRGHRDTHSTYLNVMAETGVVGFSLFAAMIILTLKTARDARKKMGAKAPALALQLFSMEVGLYSYLVAAIWGSYGEAVPTYVHLVLICVATKLLLEEGEVVRPRERKVFPAPALSFGAVGERTGASA